MMKKKGGRPVRVVNLCVLAHQLLLAGLVGKISPDLVPVLLRLQDGDEIDSRPDLFATEFATS
jgi:hypothetical protein